MCSVLGVFDRANVVVAAIALHEIDANASIDTLLVGFIVIDLDVLVADESGILVKHDVGHLSEEDGADIGHVSSQDKVRCFVELDLLCEFVIDQEALIAVVLVVERGFALGLSWGWLMVEDDAVGEVCVHQCWLLVASAVGLVKD